MIERERRDIIDMVPRDVTRVGGCLCAMIGKIDQCVMGHADHTLARVTIDSAERLKLLEVDAAQARFLGQFAAGRLLEIFVHFHKPAGKRPPPGEGLAIALNE